MGIHLNGSQDNQEFYTNKPSALVEINMTPFVDVCLVLLIIFMVTAPFAISGIHVRLPGTQAKPLSMSNTSLTLTVSKTGGFYLGKNKIEDKDLIVKIKNQATQIEKSAIFIRADRDVPYGKVMFAMAAAQRAGIEKIGMVGENKSDSK